MGTDFEQKLNEILIDENILDSIKGMVGMGGRQPIPPKYWAKMDPRVIKTLSEPPTNSDFLWALKELLMILAPEHAQALKDEIKRDSKQVIEFLKKEADKVLRTMGRKATI